MPPLRSASNPARPRPLASSGASAIEALEQRVVPAAAIFDLGSIDATSSVKIIGLADSDGTGVAVSLAGDVNNDDFDDFIIGARGADPNGSESGASYVVFGKTGGLGASFDLSTLNGTNGFKISGEAATDSSGSAVSRAGDIDGDGFDDLLVGAYSHDPAGATGAGAVYVIYGKAPPFAANVSLSSLGITKIVGEDGADRFGLSVAAAGDVNKDGKADLILGAPSAGPGDQPGKAYVIFGKTGGLGASVNLSTLTGADGFRIDGGAEGDYAGRSVSGAGDINGDGFDDVIVGAYGADPNAADESGAAYVIFGKGTAFGAAIALSTLAAADGFKINGEAAGDYAGWSVSSAGDMNGDGFSDLLIGAKGANSYSGAAYVVFGKNTSFGASLDLSALTGTNGFKIPGHEAGANLGSIVSAAGDLNHDGFDDIVVGADRARPNTDVDAGSAYVVFGKSRGFAASLDLTTLNGTNGFRINGDAAGDRAGFAVSAVGDLNGDGIDDLLVGAPDLAGTPGPGSAFVIYGERPAITYAKNFRTATFTDSDGDLVTVRVNKGTLDDGNFELGTTGNLLRLNLADDGTEFAGADVSITARKVRGGTGDGKVHVGAIDATGIDLRNVTVSGDLGQIDAGNADLLTSGIASLSVGSLGALAGTQPVGTLDGLHSEIEGKLGRLRAAGIVKGFVDVTGAIGPVTIGGSLDGSAVGATAGLLRATGDIGAVSVKLSILGGADAAGLEAGGKLGRVTVGADLSSADAAKPVHIFGNAAAAFAIAGLSVKGNILNTVILGDPNTTHNQSTQIGDANIGAVSVKGNWTGSHLQATGNVGNVTVGGTFTGDPSHGIVGGGKLGRVSIGGDLLGESTASQIIICAVGKLGGLKAADALAIAGLTVKGRVENAGILAGYSPTLGAASRDASMGAVSVGGTWIASSLVAGVSDDGQTGFGIGDTPIQSNDTALIAKIASVTIKGTVDGSAIGGHFGITAEQIGTVKINGLKQALTKGVDDILPNPAPVDPNFRIVEVPKLLPP